MGLGGGGAHSRLRKMPHAEQRLCGGVWSRNSRKTDERLNSRQHNPRHIWQAGRSVCFVRGGDLEAVGWLSPGVNPSPPSPLVGGVLGLFPH